jgi:hypothetical protein
MKLLGLDLTAGSDGKNGTSKNQETGQAHGVFLLAFSNSLI